MTAESVGATHRPADLSCATVLLSALKGQRGIVSAALNANSQLLSLRFDPGLTSDQEVGQVADQVATRLAAQRETCGADGGARCATCLGQLADLPASVTAAERSADGFLLQLGPDVASAREVTRTVPAGPAGETQGHGAAAADEDQVRPLLIATIFCFVFLAGGYAAAKLGATPWVAIPLYVASYAAGGYFPIQEGFVALVKEKNLDINFLMILGAIGAAFLGRWEEGATLMFLFTLSGTLEAFAVGRTRAAIRNLMALAPEDALVRRDGAESRIPVEQVERGDLIIAGPGERIAADGDIVKGSSAVNEAAITGESIPADKSVGDKVFAGTVNGHGVLEFTVSKRAGETTLARIVRVVEEAQAQKASSQRLTDWIDRYYTLIVITVATLAWLIPPVLGWNTWAASFYRAMMLLVVASPCALVISTPAAILSAIARAARAGILFKGGRHLEQAALIQVVAFDKTGTLTTGRPSVVEVIAEQGVTEAELIRLAAAAESRSEHPLAAAVLRSAKERGLSYPLADEFHALAGLGARAVVEGREVHVGSPRLLEVQGVTLSDQVQARLEGLFASGLTTMVVVADGKLLGALGLADTPRPEAREALAHLKRLGVKR
ncbi:MAG: putative cadmium-transporting ATPase, partial [Firmicutes bacterium]|nr:putative cadmium-transporting ATPase [Bacillota bacterium]